MDLTGIQWLLIVLVAVGALIWLVACALPRPAGVKPARPGNTNPGASSRTVS